jgi:hypothetical protein
LRQQLEHQNVLLAEDFLAAFAPLQEKVAKAERVVLSLEASCAGVAARLDDAESAMCAFTNRATELMRKQSELSGQADEVALFLRKYSLTEAEVDALQSAPLDSAVAAVPQTHSAEQSAQDGGDADGSSGNSSMPQTNAERFFAALRRLRRVRRECCKLVGSRHQSAAFELLELLSAQQERAYERAYHWAMDRVAAVDALLDQGHSGRSGGSGAGNAGAARTAAGGNSNQNVEALVEAYLADPVLALALQALRTNRPEFFAHCQEALAATRRSWLVQRFVLALTVGLGGGSGGGSARGGQQMQVHGYGGGNHRPIELQAHDAARYVSDMLAWCHQTMAAEKEFLTMVLFSAPDEDDDDDANEGDDENEGGEVGGAGAGKPAGYGEDEDENGNDEEGFNATDNAALLLFPTPGALLRHVVQGLARPLKVRIASVLDQQLRAGSTGSSSSGSNLGAGDHEAGGSSSGGSGGNDGGGFARGVALVVTYKLYHLLSFYQLTVHRLLRAGPANNDKKSIKSSSSGGGNEGEDNDEDGDGLGQELEEPSPLEVVLAECQGRAAQVFGQQLKRHAQALASLQGEASPLALDLAASPLVNEHCKRLGELLEAHASSFLEQHEWQSLAAVGQQQRRALAWHAEIAARADGSSQPDGGLGALEQCRAAATAADAAATEAAASVDMERILAAVLEPLLAACRASGEGWGLNESDMATLMVNAAAAMKSAVGGYAAAAGWAQSLEVEMDTWLGMLVQTEASRVLDASGLSCLLDSFQLHASSSGGDSGGSGPAAHEPGLDAARVESVVKRFYASLFALVMPSFDKLQPLDARDQARRKIALAVADGHAAVYAAVKDPKNEYADTSFLLHTPEQVRMLLDCD